MHLEKDTTKSLALFCKVVDNYGDIGICWRFARQLQQEHGIVVSLWVDDLVSFQRICPQVAIDLEQQVIAEVLVRHWRDQDGRFTVADVPDIVIEFFACDIPLGLISAMAERTPRPVWLNLEGLTAEEWVEGCHTLSSPHPRLALTKYFFFPGFTAKTGGVLLESGLQQERQQFQSDPVAMHAFLAQFGVTAAQMESFKIALFCYPQAPVAALFEAWQTGNRPITCLVPQGVAVAAVQAFLGGEASVGASATRGALSLHVLPFIPQTDYDKLLWACDLNFVRGEDSFVRAQLAAKPFIWHIYPQDENLHHIKLRAFLGRYALDAEHLCALSLAWNAASTADASTLEWSDLWQQFLDDMPKMNVMALNWQRQLAANGDMTSNLLDFVDTLKLAGAQK
ncbi:elongation factor P maturation arginine rhamnosyltransferase EarP [Undibacterium sp. Ren11W]|uniref:elongation factor P maturation arginine rhamnosyltransferase EarP n=1 Tax=Undibacterium sp. Ren11W TaxID=3413045 RepID=UPI003BF2D57C